MTSLPGQKHPQYRHGGTMNGKTPEYHSWEHMRERCLNPTHPRYADYGGRGITVCERWRNNYATFASDMGPRPSGFTLDRIDTNGPYEPGNCRWSSPIKQNRNSRRNRRITFNGETLALVEWSERVGLSQKTLLSRLRRGWSVQDAFTLPRKQLAPGRHFHAALSP